MTISEITERAVKRIRETVANPVRIVLFGSAARGEMGPNSDIDILVVVQSGTHRRKTAQQIYRNTVDIGFALDILVVTTDDVAQYRDHPGMAIGAALAEGQDLYVA